MRIFVGTNINVNSGSWDSNVYYVLSGDHNLKLQTTSIHRHRLFRFNNTTTAGAKYILIIRLIIDFRHYYIVFFSRKNSDTVRSPDNV